MFFDSSASVAVITEAATTAGTSAPEIQTRYPIHIGREFQEGALMNVEYTGRHYVVTPTIRKEVETGLTKIRKILGDRFDANVILAVEKHRHKAEITISPRNGPIVGLAQANDMAIAVNQALDHLQRQAVRYKTRCQSKKPSCAKTRGQK